MLIILNRMFSQVHYFLCTLKKSLSNKFVKTRLEGFRKPYEKLQGIDYIDIISEWVNTKYRFEHVIILININVQAKNIEFWANVPQTHAIQFLKEVVILKCKDKSELQRLVQNTGLDFAEAYGYSGGVRIIDNKEIQ